MRIRTSVVCACVVVLALSACGSDKKKSQGAPNPSAPVTTTTVATSASSSTSTSVSHPVVTDVFPTITLPCQPIPIPKTPVKSPAAGPDVYLTSIDQRVDTCVDHVIFGFKNSASGPPGYSITYGSPPFAQDGSGTPVPVRGRAFIVVQVKPGYGFDFVTNQPTYTGLKRIPFARANHVTEVVETGDYEGVLTWVIGLDSKRSFSVEATGAPQTQLVVTVS